MDRESDLLLPQHEPTNTNAQNGTSERELSRRERLAEVLESPRLHKTIIALIIIDAICVLADLSYTFLNDTCSPADELEEDPIWLEILSHISLAITTFFLVEIPLTVYGFGWRYYNPVGTVLHSRLHLFDAAVILTTFILEVILRGKERELAGLLIILRLWRLVKLVGGIAVGAGELSEETEKKLAEVQEQLLDAQKQLQQATEENIALRSRLSQASK